MTLSVPEDHGYSCHSRLRCCRCMLNAMILLTTCSPHLCPGSCLCHDKFMWFTLGANWIVDCMFSARYEHCSQVAVHTVLFAAVLPTNNKSKVCLSAEPGLPTCLSGWSSFFRSSSVWSVSRSGDSSCHHSNVSWQTRVYKCQRLRQDDRVCSAKQRPIRRCPFLNLVPLPGRIVL